MECLFCKIARGEIPSHKVYDGEKFFSFLDINPRAKGHCLVIPRKHYSSLLEMTDDEMHGLFVTAKMVAGKTVSKLGASGFNIFINNGDDAGQVIPHVHVHVLPRYKDEGSKFAIEAGFPVKESLRERLPSIAAAMKED